ncbi:MAG: MarR family transcriptional regulator [Anaerolineae bacterium]|nr:MarR family transcriptional regulator [Anaerolineae bacterium]
MHPIPDSDPPPDWARAHARIHERLSEIFQIDDTRGLRLFGALQHVAHLSRSLDSQLGEDLELSGPRWMLLLRLLIVESLGETDGLTPTVLSQTQRVSKNTISALLRGLEAQGLIERRTDPADLRAFRIHLTDAGRDYVRSTAPGRIASLNALLAGLDLQEQDHLVELLEKLRRSLMERVSSPVPPQAAGSHTPE